jgi:hypothetical protein
LSRSEGSSSPQTAVGIGALGWLRPLAIVLIVSALGSRAILPGLRGSVVGISELIDLADTSLGLVAQLTAILLLTVAVWLVVQILQSRASLYLKLMTVFVVGLVMLGSIFSMLVSRPPIAVTAIMCFACSAVAVVQGLHAFREREVGLVALAPMLAGIASVVRAIGAIVSDRAAELRVDVESMVGAFRFATVLATVSFFLALASLALIWVWTVRRSPRIGGAVVGGVVVVVTAAALAAASSPDDLEPTIVVVLRRAIGSLLTRPAPLLPPVLPMAMAVAAPVTAIAVLAARRAAAPLVASVALASLAGDAADIPILGLALVCGSLGLGAYALDPRGVFHLLAKARSEPSSGEPTAADEGPRQPAAPSDPSLPHNAT